MPRATPLARRPFFAALVALAAALPATSTRAAGPEFIEIDDRYVDPFLSEFCGFPVEIHLQGKLIIKPVGAAVTTRGSGYRATYTNLDTGATVTQHVSGVVFESDVFEGNLYTYEFSFSGGTKFVSARNGAVVSAGHQTFRVVVDLERFQLILVESRASGHFDSFTAELLCEWLSD